MLMVLCSRCLFFLFLIGFFMQKDFEVLRMSVLGDEGCPSKVTMLVV